MYYRFSRATGSLGVVLCLLAGFAGGNAAFATDLTYEPWAGGLANPPHPAKPFFTKGAPVTTTVLADGSGGTAVFNYDNNTTSNTGGARGSWQFSTVATVAGEVTLHWDYSGYHARKKVYENLEVFLVRNDEFQFTTLVEAGPTDRTSLVSADFAYYGTTVLNVLAGEQYGFRIAGGNSDQESTLRGTLSVEIELPITVDPVADITVAEDSAGIEVDLSTTFTSSTELELTVDISNPALFETTDLTGTDLTLTPAENQNGSATVTVTATSAFGSSAETSFEVAITPVNDPPFLVQDPSLQDIQLLLGAQPDLQLELSPFFDDIDLAIEGDTLTYSAVAGTGGVVQLNLSGSVLEIVGVGVGTTNVTVSVRDTGGETASDSFEVTATDPSVFGDANLIYSVPISVSEVGVAVRATGEVGPTTQHIQVLTSASCDDGFIGSDAEVFAEIPVGEFDGNGEFLFLDIVEPQASLQTYAAARLSSGFTSGANSACIVVGPDNDSWVRALEVDLTPGGEISLGGEGGFLDRPGNARWYKFAIQPGARATIDLSSLPADYDLFVFKDIGQAFLDLEGDTDVNGLNRLSAEFAPSTFAPSTFAPSVFAPSTFAPDAYAPSQFAPSTFAPSVFAPSTFAPSTFAPSTFAPSTFAPSTFAPSTFAPSTFAPSTFAPSTFAPSTFAAINFVNAQIRSLIAVSAQTGTGSERVVADTWNNTGFFYIRVSGKNGAFDLQQPFGLDVELDGVDCSGVAAVAGSPSGATAGGYRSIILWDSDRVANDPENSTAEFNALQANLAALAARPEVSGVIVDLADNSQVQALHAQADANTSCPYAENLTAGAIKQVVDDYRELNPGLDYVVLVGGDVQIPFFRYPDQGLLGPEQDYDPPMANDTQSQSALKLNYIIGQDAYGSDIGLSLRDGTLPLPDASVGRLVETAGDMNRMLEAYLETTDGVVPTPTSSLVTGYDFLVDVAEAIQAELEAGLGGGRNDTLITAADISPEDERSWTADDLRRELLEEREDIIFLAGHFSANSALAADYKTSALTTELVASPVDLTNVIVYSEGCHSGYNIANPEIVQGVTQPLDWTQAFAQKGATLIAGSGYQYGDTDLIEYGERLYLGFTRELRTGSGPVSVGEALVRAKQDYLETTPDLRGLHRKTIIISTLFGLPMLSVDMPGQRIPEPERTPSVIPSLVSGAPGEVLGLQSADVSLLFETGADGALLENFVELKNIEDDSLLQASYFEGADGVISYPAEPTLPLVTRDVTAASATPLSLRGVGFRGGSWRDSLVLPLTGAPTTELRGVHTPFVSTVFFPMRIANANYYDALTGGSSTLLHVTPTQHRVENVGDFEAVRRQFDTLQYRLYYSDNTREYPTDPPSQDPNRPALASPPTMSGVVAVTDGDDVVFFANVVVDPSAGVQSVWVTHTDGGDTNGNWVSLDLEQDAEISTLWSARLVGGANAFDRLEFVVQAVSGTGLVTLDDNFGAFYRINGELGEVGSDGRPFDVFDTETSIDGFTVGTYGDSVALSANLSSGQIPIANASVVFTIGGSGRAGQTNIEGDVTVSLPITAKPGDYEVTASFAGNSVYAPSSASQSFTVERATTELLLEFGQQSVEVDGIEPGVTATLRDQFDTPLLQRTVYFTLEDSRGGLTTIPVITNYVGQATLPKLQLPGDDYNLTVRFLGAIPTPAGVQVLDDPVYQPSEASGMLTLSGGDNCPTEVFKDPGRDPTLTVSGFCYLAFDVRGKANVTDGTLIVGEGVRVTKKVDQFGEGGVIVLEGGSIGDKVLEFGPGDVIIYGTVENPVSENGSGDLIIGETGLVLGNVDESGDGMLQVSGETGGNVKESAAGDLLITPSGVVNGNATELGAGGLTNEGVVTGNVSQD